MISKSITQKKLNCFSVLMNSEGTENIRIKLSDLFDKDGKRKSNLNEWRPCRNYLRKLD
jgi:hypothetical protein